MRCLCRNFAQRIVFVLALAVTRVSFAGMPGGRIEQPISVNVLPPAGLVVLGSKGTVYQLQGENLRYRLARTFQIPGNEYPGDMTLGQVNGIPYLFVSSNLVSGLNSSGKITQYTLEGKVVRTWWIRGVCAGIDYDPVHQVLYLAASDRNEIFSIEIGENGSSAKSRGSIRGASQIGPLVFDSGRQQIYVGDMIDGGIYKFDLASAKSSATLSVKQIGGTTALFFDKTTSRLYAVDEHKAKLVVIDTTTRAAPQVLKTDAKMTHPSAVAYLAGGILAVGDYDQDVLLFFSNDGKLLGRYPG